MPSSVRPCLCYARPASNLRNSSAPKPDAGFPQINFENVKWCIWESESGFLTARRNCQVVLENFLAEGGEYRELSVAPGAIQGREMGALTLSAAPLFRPTNTSLRAVRGSASSFPM